MFLTNAIYKMNLLISLKIFNKDLKRNMISINNKTINQIKTVKLIK
jgi:hypothetical protein